RAYGQSTPATRAPVTPMNMRNGVGMSRRSIDQAMSQAQEHANNVDPEAMVAGGPLLAHLAAGQPRNFDPQQQHIAALQRQSEQGHQQFLGLLAHMGDPISPEERQHALAHNAWLHGGKIGPEPAPPPTLLGRLPTPPQTKI